MFGEKSRAKRVAVTDTRPNPKHNLYQQLGNAHLKYVAGRRQMAWRLYDRLNN